MSGNLYPALVRLLRDAGCTLIRQGAGSHEVWRSPMNGQHVVVPRNTEIRHTANKILKDAGLPKAF